MRPGYGACLALLGGVVGALALAWVHPVPVHAAAASDDPIPSLTKRYSELVRQYGNGNAADAVNALASWTAEDLQRAVQRFAGIVAALKQLFVELAKLDAEPRAASDLDRYRRRRAALTEQIERAYDAVYAGAVAAPHPSPVRGARGGAGSAGAREWQDWQRGLPTPIVAQLRAAVGLHTAVAAAAWRDGAAGLLAINLRFADVYLPDLLVPLDPGFAGAWCRAAGVLLTSSQQQGLALAQFDRCLAWLPRDPWLVLGRGSARESAARSMASLPPGATLANWPDRQPVVANEEARAAADYERAVALDPGLEEAWIRLARLRLTKGDPQSAARDLARVESASLAPVPAYWRSLLLGALAEAERKPEEAAGDYRAALQAYPNGQSAAVALSHVMAESLGDRAGAAQLLREHLTGSPTRNFSSDPWWLYDMGQAWRVSDWLEDIARRSRSHEDER
ncbi:MAG: tetratricopeptide repeat protein [Betaproteobacteria bacterium]